MTQFPMPRRSRCAAGRGLAASIAFPGVRPAVRASYRSLMLQPASRPLSALCGSGLLLFLSGLLLPGTAAAQSPPVPCSAYSDRFAVWGCLADAAALRAGLPAALVRAVVAAESAWNPRAVSPKGARGLMQVLPATAADYEADVDLFDPEANLRVGTRHLRRMVDAFGIPGGVAAYNAGEGAFRRADVLGSFPETREFLRRVLAFWGRYRAVRTRPSSPSDVGRSASSCCGAAFPARPFRVLPFPSREPVLLAPSFLAR